MKNLIVGQSGGPTAVINSSLYGVIREGFNRSEEIEHVYGMINGIQGFLDGRFMDMKELDNDTLEALRTTPGAYLGSCRFKLPDDLNDAIYPLLFQKFEEMNIGYFFYIGGNDSMDTVSKLSRYAAAHNIDVRIMGIPKTIDNDLILTDHTPDSAVPQNMWLLPSVKSDWTLLFIIQNLLPSLRSWAAMPAG